MNDEDKIVFLKDHFSYEVHELLNARFFLKAVKDGNISYEVSNLKTREKLGEISKELGNIYMNVAIEHALLHSRALYEFFFLPEPNPRNYPRAVMFADFPPPRFTDNISKDFYEKVNSQITHLGAKRFEEAQKKFNYNETLGILNYLLKISNDFIMKLDAKYVSDNLMQLSDQLNKNIRNP